MSKKTEQANRIKRTKDIVEFAKLAISKNAVDADAVLISHHVVKDGRITHYFDANIPIDDWGKCMIAMGVEAKNNLLRAQTGGATVAQPPKR